MTEKETAYLWLTKQTDPAKIDQLDVRGDLISLGASEAVAARAETRIKDEIARWRSRFTEYLNKRGVKP